MTILAILASIFGVVGALSNSAQAHKIYKRKSARDISALTYTILTIGSIVWILYGLEIKSVPIILVNIIVVIIFIIILVGWYLYGRN